MKNQEKNVMRESVCETDKCAGGGTIVAYQRKASVKEF